jgi:hypothetical protein
MNLDEYELEARALYAEFAANVAGILTTAIERRPSASTGGTPSQAGRFAA